MKKLYNLWLFFILYYIVKVIIDLTVGWISSVDLWTNNPVRGIVRISRDPVTFYVLFFVGSAILFAIGLWLFYMLLRKKNWARIVLLVIGWLTIVDAISGFLFQSYVTGILSVVDQQADWDRLLLSDHLTDLLGLIYFGYLVYLLQFEKEVKQMFLHPEDDRNRIPPPS